MNGMLKGNSILWQLSPQVKRHYSKWNIPPMMKDLFRTGQLNPPNPMIVHIENVMKYIDISERTSIAPLPDFKSIELRHLEPAIRQLLKEYEKKASEMETELDMIIKEKSKLKYMDIMTQIYKMDLPIRHMNHWLELMRSVAYPQNTNPKMISKLSEMIENQNLDQYRPMQIQIFNKLLEEEELTKERKRVLESLISKDSLFTSDESSFQSLQSNLHKLEHSFSRQSLPPARKAVPLMYEILTIKKEMANLVGYDNYADCCLHHDRMAPDIQSIQELHDTISNKVNPIVESIVSGKTKMQLVGLDGHFELSLVLQGLFHLIRTLFGVNIVPDKNEISYWNNDVKFFHLYDDTNEYLGSFFLDPFSRPYKQGGEWMGPIIDKTDSSTPLVYISTYIDPPVWSDSPAYMTFKDVKGLFHEFGHMLQFLLMDVEFGSLSGLHAIDVDANEFVSQFMEYWLYNKQVLSTILPKDYPMDDIYNELTLQRQHESALKFTAQTYLGQLEMDLHSTFDPNGDTSILQFQTERAQMYSPHDLPKKGDLSTLYSIFQSNADGNHVSSYRYLWSEVLSADAYYKFEESDDITKVGKQFRDSILRVGGSISARESFHNFRGRDATIDALLHYHGLK